jgi:glycosyltransferase involved in cell wall biosynthesis
MATATTTPSERTVLVAFHEAIPGGATLSVLRLVPLLEERGWRFSFWVPRPGPLYDLLASEGRDVDGATRHVSYSLAALRLPPGPGARLATQPRYFGALWRCRRRCSPVLAHVNSLTSLAEASLLRASGLPTVFHVHEMIPPTRKGRIARRLVRAVANEVVAVSEACGARLAGGGWRPRIVHECAPVPDQAPLRDGRGAATTVGTVGVISRRKGTDLFVEAARIVAESEPGVRFRIVGSPTDPLDAEWAEEILERARAAGIEHLARADVPAELESWDAFVLPSRNDPFPISVLEAMGSALPVVGTRVDGIPEQLADGAGILVPGEDPEALAAAILRLHRSAGERRDLGARARERVLDRYTLDRQAQGIHEAYVAALGRDPTAG